MDVMIWRLPQRSTAGGCGWLWRSSRWKSSSAVLHTFLFEMDEDQLSVIFNRWTKQKLSLISEMSVKHLKVEVVSWLKQNALDLTCSSSLLR